MARLLAAAAAVGNGAVPISTLGFAPTVFILCVAAAVLSTIVFSCAQKSKKKHQKGSNEKSREVTYYGAATGGGYKSHTGRQGAGRGFAVGAATGIVAASVVSSAGCGGGGGGCGGGGCGGGGCGGGGCGA